MTRLDCDRCISMLDDHLDGSLSGDHSGAVQEHLTDCPGCRSEYQRAEDLAAAVGDLPRSVEPDHDLWPEIASEIGNRRVVRGSFDRPAIAGHRRWWRVAAAAAVLIAAVTVAYMAGVERGRPRVAHAPPTGEHYTVAAYGDLATDLEEARDLLRGSLESRRHELSPETWAVVMDNVLVIDEAIVRIETALRENPEDSRLNRQLAVAYRRQIDLLQRATHLPAEV